MLGILIILLGLILYQDSSLILACGLFGFVGTNPIKYFSWDKFTILGLYNDSRGGDACGRVCGNIVEHGTGKLDTYLEFVAENLNPKGIELPNTILGHCRKASSGGLNVAYAQPIVLRRKDLNMKSIRDTHFKKAIRDLDGETLIFSGIHNGTIENYKELAPKYGIPVEDHNDSKVLLSALFYGNFDVLTLYRGTAAVMWHNHITNKTYVFKGASRSTAYVKTESEERPLYFYRAANSNIYISSMEESLSAIGATETTLFNLAPNIVTVFKNGKKIMQMNIDRSKTHQSKYDPIDTPPAKNYSSYYGKNNKYKHRDDLVYDDGDSGYVGRGDVNKLFPDIMPNDKALTRQLPVWQYKESNNLIGPSVSREGTPSPFVRLFEERSEPFRLQAETADLFCSKSTRRIFFNKGRYWMQGSLMHGIYLLNNAGLVPAGITVDSSILKPYYFVEGVMMDGSPAYNKVIEMHKEFIQLAVADIPSLVDVEQEFTKQITRYSRWPTVSLTGLIGEQDCLDPMTPQPYEPSFFTGKFTPLFSDREYMFDNGDLITVRSRKDGVRLATHDEDDAMKTKAYIQTCQNDLSKDEVYKIGINLLRMGGFTNPLSPFQCMVFAFLDPDDSPEIGIMMIHYFRDFRQPVRTECSVCPCAKNKSMDECMKCQDIKDELKKMAAEVNYEVFRN